MDSTFFRNTDTRYQTARVHIQEYHDIGTKRSDNLSVMQHYCKLVCGCDWNCGATNSVNESG